MSEDQQLEDYLQRLRDDFVFFTEQIWFVTGLDKKQPLGDIERDILSWVQHGPAHNGVLARRGFGKTHLVTAAATCWDLYLDCNARILIVSKSQTEAKKTLRIIRDWIQKIPFLQHLDPSQRPLDRKPARDTTTHFDVGPADDDRSPSVSANGIEGQITGTRASRVIADDVETPGNTKTLEAREALDLAVKEFSKIASYGEKRINYVGTFHHQESLYLKLADRGYTFRTWPMLYPAKDEKILNLAPMLADRLAAGTHKPGDIVAPYRDTFADVAIHKAEGWTDFAMQMMLICDLGDSHRYPLSLSDLIVFPIQRDKAPITIAWGTTNDQGRNTRIEDIQARGLGTDSLHAPIMFDQQWAPYIGTKMWIDPSGRGADKTAYGIVSNLNGYLWVKACRGLEGGYEEPVLIALALAAREHRVGCIYCEDNFGQGMFVPLFEPVLRRYFLEPGQDEAHPDGWKCSVETVRVTGQKEIRIIDALEPVMNSHRLILDRSVAANYDLQHQLTRITRQRNCLKHDDELDALASCVKVWTQDLAVDPDKAAAMHRQKLLDEELKEHWKNLAANRYVGPSPKTPARLFTHR